MSDLVKYSIPARGLTAEARHTTAQKYLQMNLPEKLKSKCMSFPNM